MAENVQIGREYAKYVCIYDNRQCSEYVSYITLHEVTLKVIEYLLRDGRTQGVSKDLRWSTLEKEF